MERQREKAARRMERKLGHKEGGEPEPTPTDDKQTAFDSAQSTTD